MDLKKTLEQLHDNSDLINIVTTMADDSKMKEFIEKTVKYLQSEINKYMESDIIINDKDDLGYFTAVQYIELKARWIQMNLRLSYQAFATGEGEPEILLRASATSYFLSIIEPHVNKSYVEEIQRLLAQPVIGDGILNVDS
jgi:hypothetical protein